MSAVASTGLVAASGIGAPSRAVVASSAGSSDLGVPPVGAVKSWGAGSAGDVGGSVRGGLQGTGRAGVSVVADGSGQAVVSRGA